MKTSSTKKDLNAKQQQLLAKAQESLAKIKQPSISSSKASSEKKDSLKLPEAIKNLHVDTLFINNLSHFNDQERGYHEELANRLRLFLKLPEQGEVKVKLTLERSGQVKRVVIESSQSLLNRQYVEKQLVLMNFPQFGNNFEGSVDYTFAISLRNEF